MASLVFVILNEVKNLAHPTDKILRFAQEDKQETGNRERETGSGKRLGFVILNEVKNLAHPTEKILRCAQDDKQG